MEVQQDVNVSETVVAREPSSVSTCKLVIRNFKTEMEKCKPGDKIESKQFKVKDNNFAVTVFPNGVKDEREGFIDLFVENRSNKEVTIDKLKVWSGVKPKERENLVFRKNWFVDKKSKRGWSKWFSHDVYKSLPMDEDFMVKVEVTCIGNRITMDKTALPQQKSSSFVLEKIYGRDMPDSDFVLMCEGEAVPCHKLVLANASEFFEGLLKPHTKEYQEGSSSLQCSAKIGRNLIKFLYTVEIEETVFNENIVDFLRLADMLFIERLKQRAEQRMLQLLSRPNMAAFFIAGADFNAEDIRKVAKKFLQSNMDWFHKQENWKEAFKQHQDLLIEVYSEMV